MRQWLAVTQVLTALLISSLAIADPAVPKRIDGGILTPLTESVRQLVSECIPIKIVVSFIILEDGTTADLKVIEATPLGVSPDILLEAVAQFQYEPIIVNGVAVKSGIQTQASIYDPIKDPRCGQFNESSVERPSNNAPHLKTPRLRFLQKQPSHKILLARFLGP